MITPSFSCTQSSTAVSVSIHVPAASDVEIHVDGTLLSVHINPYFLRLTLPGRVLEDDASSAQYDPGSGYLTVTLTKEAPGEDFKDLDILATLLAPRKPDPQTQPVIEVLASEGADADADAELADAAEKLSLEQRAVLEAAGNDWQILQQIPESLTSLHTTAQRRYGFLNMHTGYFRHVAHTENDVNELGPDIETLPVDERRSKRLVHEEEKWDEEYYMADFADDDWIKELIAYRFPSNFPGSSGDASAQFTEEENTTMLRLPSKEYIPNPDQTRALYETSITIIFSYVYDARTTQHDPTPESAWTICALTPAFSALDPPPYSSPAASPVIAQHSRGSAEPPSASVFRSTDLASTLVPSIRRALAFPLYRSFTLALACVRDVSAILRSGKRAVLRSLLAVKKVLDGHDVYYIYSKVWVDDLCVWVAKYGSDDVFKALALELDKVTFDKAMTGWDLEALERAVSIVSNREDDSDDESEDSDDTDE